MAKQEQNNDVSELRREDNVCTQIFKWNKKINKNGPVSVETIWKQWILDEWDNKRKTNEEDDE